jgi:hypothetical protein
MSNEDWTEINKRLSWVGSAVHLNCDGYKLGIYRVRRTEMRDCLVIYVNGEFKRGWGSRDCEERKRFLCPIKAYYYKPKVRAAMKVTRAKQPKYIQVITEKALGKLADPDATFTWYSQAWPNVKKLKAHLVKNNKQISIIREQAEGGNGTKN